MSEAATTTPTTDTPWHQGLDSETLGHMTAKGWDKMDARTAVAAAVKAYKAAEHFVGVPADQLMRLPKDAGDEAGWKAVHAKLGVPADATGYKFDDIKFSDGTALSDGLAGVMRQMASDNKLTPAQAGAVARGMVKYMDDAGKADTADASAKLEAEKAQLKDNWGSNFEANMFIAKQAAAKLGIPPEAVAALEKATGYSKVMDMFRTLGKQMGEDKFVASGPNGQGGPMTKAEAQARITDLKADKGFVEKYLKGDTQAKREMEALHRIVAGV